MIRYTLVEKSRKRPFKESALAHLYCQGNGLEIGAAAQNPFGLPGALNVAIEDQSDFNFFKAAQIKYCGRYAEADIWRADGKPIPVPDSSQDYVMSSHVMEHIPDVIKELIEWDRILRDGGIAFIIVPKRDALPSDIGRPVTSITEFVAHYQRGANRDNTEGPTGGHYHVFTLDSLQELIAYGHSSKLWNWDIVDVRETDDKVGNGHLIICRKLPSHQSGSEQYIPTLSPSVMEDYIRRTITSEAELQRIRSSYGWPLFQYYVKVSNRIRRK